MKRMAQNFEYSANPPLCKYYARGYCARGASCFYSHGQVGVGGMAMSAPLPHTTYAPEKLTPPSSGSLDACPDYSQGFCAKGSACPFKHVLLPPEKVSFVNFTYHRIQVPEKLTDEFLDEQITRLDYNKPTAEWVQNHSDLTGSISYIQMKSCYIDNIPISQREGIWATTPKNTLKVLEAYLKNDHVILVFSVNNSRKFYGYARMESLPQESLSVGHFGPMEQRFLGPCFKVSWLNTQVVSFEKVGDITNSLNGNLPVKISRDGQELSADAGEKLCKVLDNEAVETGINKLDSLNLTEERQELSVETASISTENSVVEGLLKASRKNSEEERKGKRLKRSCEDFKVVVKPKKKKEEGDISNYNKEEAKVANQPLF
eukprot:TRINITY_DN71000_c0_g1_i1.p10 TRINITY_DN71000_c0_g1~~TRINITY_DN71000_c0_g1_i1.p10  ORF type:complete len:375 (-),score=24.12 TRINITY_DN71000_c0_g1_i1:11048-12172(-)